jgi:hypothetical protein
MRRISLGLVASLTLAVGCGGDDGSEETGPGTASSTSSGTSAAEDGSESGVSGDADTNASGDGDGSSGDGDGASGDGDGASGDGDGTAGDGDGSSGDGDGSSGDGDGASGDGDGASGDGDGASGDGDGSSGDGDGATGDGDGTGCTSCSPTQVCFGQSCVELCDLAESQNSSIGCSFFANRMLNLSSGGDSLVVGNTDDARTANVQLYQVQGGVEVAIGTAQPVAPLSSHVFSMPEAMPNKASLVRADGVYRVQSDIPVVAYQHSPIDAVAHNDSSMLLPEHAQQSTYIIASYRPVATVVDHRSYFNVIGLTDGTTVTWEPPVNTAGGGVVPAVTAGGSGDVVIDRYDLLQVVGPNDDTDITGTIVTTSAPAWVVGASMCSVVPENSYACDHLEEQMLPLDYWGRAYVGAHAPTRGTESYYWRIFSGADGVTVTTSPAQPGTPVTLNRGEWVEIIADESFIFTGDGPFLPVQYLASQNAGAGTGDPAMMQAVPVEQFLSRYVFVTGSGYSEHYAQVIRPVGAADVQVDGTTVTGYYTVGGYEIADWPVSEGAHAAVGTTPFGIMQVGYTGVTSYAYPGGMQLLSINPQ